MIPIFFQSKPTIKQITTFRQSGCSFRKGQKLNPGVITHKTCAHPHTHNTSHPTKKQKQKQQVLAILRWKPCLLHQRAEAKPPHTSRSSGRQSPADE